ncbi:MAG: GNAT family N-acetyltransferase [Fusobacteriaceae bacterium]
MQEIFLTQMKEREIPLIYKKLHLKYVEKYSCDRDEEMEEAYTQWYRFMLNSPCFLLYTVKNKKGEFIGTLKFHLEKKDARVDIFLDKDFRGKKLSENILGIGILKILENHKIERFLAYIIKENEISKHLFEKLGFRYIKNANYNGVRHMLYEKRVVQEKKN